MATAPNSYGAESRKKKSGAKNAANVQLPSVATQTTENGDTDAEHSRLITWINETEDNTLHSRSMSEKSRDYYDSIQWTPEEVSKLKKQKQSATVINRIKPKMDGLMGMERVNKTTAKAFPRTPKHQQAATAASEAIRFVLQDNMYADCRSSSWDNLIIEGTCGAEILVKKSGVKGDDFKIVIRNLMWDRLVYDSFSRRKDFSDARFLGQVVWMDYDEAIAMYPGTEDVLENTIGGNSNTWDDKPRWADGSRRRVKIVELYYRQDGDVHYACFTRGGFLKAPKISPYVNEENQTEWPYEFASVFVTRECERYGAVLQLLDIQDEINKRRSKALHLMSVRQVRWERGAVEDINKARQELAKPDGVIETTPGMEFEILKTGDMATAQFNLLTEAKQEIDAVSYSSAAAGKENRNMSGVALRSREMASQTELAPMFDVLKNYDVRIYRKVWNRIKQYWKSEKWIRVTDDENNLKFVGLNKPMTAGEQLMQKAQAAGLPPDQIQQLQQRIAQDPAMQQVVGTENDIAELDMDIIIDDAPDAVTTQAEDFAVLGEMVKSGFQMPAEAVIEASPLASKDKILKMMKEQRQQAVPPQVQQQMQKMQEEMQKLAQENQALKTGQQESMAKIQVSRQEGMAKIAVNKEIEEARIFVEAQANVDAAIETVKSLIKQHEVKIQSMIEVAMAKADADRMVSDARLETKVAGMMQPAAEEAGAEVADVEVESAGGAAALQPVLEAIAAQHEQFMEAMGGMMAALQAKKNIQIMRNPQTGRIDGAEVTQTAAPGMVPDAPSSTGGVV